MSPDDRAEVDRVAAKLMAIEAIVVQVLKPLLEAVQPGTADRVIEVIRAGLNVPTQNEFQTLAIEEYLLSFADGLEAHLRARLRTSR